MLFSRLPKFALAMLLGLLLPLEPAHCAFMGVQPHAACATSSAPSHACCGPSAASHAAHHPGRAPARGCACALIPAGAVSAAIAVERADASLAFVPPPAAPTVIEPVSASSENVPALDVGSPPLPFAPGAHGLRAPPVSA